MGSSLRTQRNQTFFKNSFKSYGSLRPHMSDVALLWGRPVTPPNFRRYATNHSASTYLGTTWTTFGGLVLQRRGGGGGATHHW